MKKKASEYSSFEKYVSLNLFLFECVLKAKTFCGWAYGTESIKQTKISTDIKSRINIWSVCFLQDTAS